MADAPLPVQVVGWLTDPQNWRGSDGVAARLVEHVGMTAAAVGIACAVAVPLGLWLGHLGRGRVVVVGAANVGRAVPVFAVLVLLAIGPIRGALASTIVALTLFAIPPVLTATYTGVREVDVDVVDAARGTGMSPWQVLVQAELPLATPLLVAGVRLATVQVVATATIAALVAGGGLGRIITAGFATVDLPELVSGAVLVALLALAVETGFGLWGRARSRRMSYATG